MSRDATRFATNLLCGSHEPEVGGIDSSSDFNVDRNDYSRQLANALRAIERLIIEGLAHGFFDYSISCEIVSGGKRRMQIRAGKSHQFTIPEHELPK
jgi:hypothetical protein